MRGETRGWRAVQEGIREVVVARGGGWPTDPFAFVVARVYNTCYYYPLSSSADLTPRATTTACSRRHDGNYLVVAQIFVPSLLLRVTSSAFLLRSLLLSSSNM